MAALQNFGGVSSKSWEKREKDEEGRDRETLMDVFCATVREVCDGDVMIERTNGQPVCVPLYICMN